MEQDKATGLQKFTLGVAIFSLLVNLLNLNTVRTMYPNYFSSDYQHFGEDIAGLGIVIYWLPSFVFILTLMIVCLIQHGLKPKKIMISIILLFVAHCSIMFIIGLLKTSF
ncbi:hypothetical protein IKG45_02405 [Candidatus Saccharibacteria bacterium]|nr:hypothetical protein [Candidatus Saccharibacteria bacterium]